MLCPIACLTMRIPNAPLLAFFDDTQTGTIIDDILSVSNLETLLQTASLSGLCGLSMLLDLSFAFVL